MTKQEIRDRLGFLVIQYLEPDGMLNVQLHKFGSELKALWNEIDADMKSDPGSPVTPTAADRIAAAETYRKMFDDGGYSDEFRAVMTAMHDIATDR